MPTPTYDLLASSVLTTATASVTFASISQDFRDLVLVVDYQVASDSVLLCRVNGDSGSNYPRVFMLGRGAGPFTFASTETSFRGVFGQVGIVNNAIFQFMDYSATDKHKTVLYRGNSVTEETVAGAARFASTSAITSLLLTGAVNFEAGSTFHLYGIAA